MNYLRHQNENVDFSGGGSKHFVSEVTNVFLALVLHMLNGEELLYKITRRIWKRFTCWNFQFDVICVHLPTLYSVQIFGQKLDWCTTDPSSESKGSLTGDQTCMAESHPGFVVRKTMLNKIIIIAEYLKRVWRRFSKYIVCFCVNKSGEFFCIICNYLPLSKYIQCPMF